MRFFLKKKYFAFFFLALVFAFGVFIEKANAETRSYEYASIDTFIEVREDSTLKIEESQTFSFSGTFHQGWREIPMEKIAGISDISVFDKTKGEQLEYSRKRLNKEDSLNWGKYTFFKENGKQIIEWYFDASDEDREWVISYTVHGAIEFLKNQTRLYWNIFTNYPVPVRSSRVEVKLPASVDARNIIASVYRSGAGSAGKLDGGGNTVFFQASYFESGEAFTIDVGWLRGVPSLFSFFKDYFSFKFGYILSFVLFLFALVIGSVHWYKGKTIEKGSGTIIPEYDSPDNVHPVFAEVLMRESITPKGFSACIVSLATRGYVKIQEEEKKDFFGSLFSKKSFSIIRMKDPDASLLEFEREYMNALFKKGNSFSFKEIKNNKLAQKDFSEDIRRVKEKAFEELDIKIGAFKEGGMKKDKFAFLSVFSAILLVVLGTVAGEKIFFSHVAFQAWFLGLSAVAISFALWGFMKFEAELSEKGIEMKQKLLGFKMFLSVTEKDRVKNLTPDMFEKYLPYAMIFGVEKQWSKKFEEMHLTSPEWYAGAHAVNATSGAIDSAFSPVSLSNSLSSSFTSAFMSVGGGGAGSGGAGGGGGGGGGGAS